MSIISALAKAVPFVVEGIKALPKLGRVIFGKSEPLDPALGESQAEKVLREAREKRAERRHK